MMMWDWWVLGLPCEQVSPTKWPVDRPQVGEYPDAYARRLVMCGESKTAKYRSAAEKAASEVLNANSGRGNSEAAGRT